ncbi:Ldh family oxidoreductase [Marinigracilibium pacificum]|uniref:Ldh family oxidoreductase n=1 Tax=Marinigracilibium pacificum TaxID=2729599 RepID=A0A848J8L8_9BACT|nr:Ldh family oxidoreductase [Marinigracilibium pacificum]NMM49402.1 Ldh family oxidoreductase [Marinigracilibium pacificum]
MTTLYSYQELYKFAYNIFLAIGCDPMDAEQATKTLLSADLRGVDSHGIARLIGYVRLWESKRVNPKPEIKVVHETPSTAVIDGDSGLGLVVGPQAMKLAMQKAENVGTGWVAVKNSNHYGIAGYHSMMALEKDMIGFSFTNASPLVAPTYGKERMLGTNPISVAIPTNKETPFIADMATTTAANGKLEILQRKNQEAPLGWVQDQDGNQTTDPEAVKSGGALLPLGGSPENAGHKGYILGSIVDILSGVLSGANYGPWVPPFVSFLPVSDNPVGEGLGHFFGAMRVDAFRPKEDFLNHMDNWIKRFRETNPIDSKNQVKIPGDPEREFEKERSVNGIPLLQPVVDSLKVLSEKLDVELPEAK